MAEADDRRARQFLDEVLDDRARLENPARRRQLLQLLVAGGLSCVPGGPAGAFWFGSKSRKLPDDQSIFTLKGDVRVNGSRADKQTRIRAGDSLRTGDRSEIVFAVGGDSFILRSNSEMEIGGGGFLIDSLRVLTGRVLSVFARRQAGQSLNLSASTATIGIRGSGVYLEVEPDLTYLCTCYGQVALSASDDPDDSELITTANHDSPRYITRAPSQGSRIRPAPVINHTNTELQLLEELVGRKVPRHLRKAYIKY